MSFIPYNDDDTVLEGFAACVKQNEKNPLVILCHAFKGCDAFICEKANDLAACGYLDLGDYVLLILLEVVLTSRELSVFMAILILLKTLH